MGNRREDPGAGGASHGLLSVPNLPAAPEPIAEKVYAAERAVASVRLAVAVFSTAIYFALPDRALTIPWLAWPIIVVALTYSLLVVVFEPYRRFPILLSSYATTAADALLIALWLVATGGVYSPFYVIWYGSVVAIAFRFDIRGSLVASTLYIVLYLAVLAALGQFSGHLIEATLRSGYMLFIAVLATLLSHYAIEQERAKVANYERELAAERAEKYFQELLESAPDANVMTNRSGRILHVNAELEKLYGYSREKLIGSEIEQLLPERYRALHVEHRERYCLDPKRRQMGVGLDIVGRRRDGSEFPAEMSLSPIDTNRGLVVASTIRDITARKIAEKALRESEESYRQLVESSPDAILLHIDGRIVYANPAAVALLRAAGADELAGRSALDFVHPDHLEVARERVRLSSKKVNPLHPETLVRLDGTTFDAEVEGSPIVYQGRPAAQLIVRDVSAAKVAERMRRDLVAMMSHDLKTPLGVIIGFIDILREGNLETAESRDFLDRMELNAFHALNLAINFVDAARIDSGELQLQLGPASLNEIVLDAVRSQASRARLRSISVDVRLADDLPEIEVDRQLIDRALENLLTNALKYSPEGGRVRIETASRNGRSLIVIADEGPGVAPEDRPKLFRRYSQLAASRSGSSGLGLFIVKTIVEAHGGSVKAEFPSAGGSVFSIYLDERGVTGKEKKSEEDLSSRPRLSS